MKLPDARETKRCPKCGETAVFRDRVLPPGVANRLTQGHHAASEYVAAWKCENADCDYFEMPSR
jgi:predicted nucleic-acid-binding Zn-ribbon protein